MVTKKIEDFLTDACLEHLQGYGVEPIMMEDRQKLKCDVFQYAAWCEHNFELNTSEQGYTRQTTFTSDLSIAEWLNNPDDVVFTAHRSILEYYNNVEYFGELLMAVNMKSWEHYERGNHKWAMFYADLFYVVKDTFFYVAKLVDDYDKYWRFYMDHID